MTQFRVQDMTCGHCVSTVQKALAQIDPQAQVQVDLAQHLVTVESALPAERIASAIREAGYTPLPA